MMRYLLTLMLCASQVSAQEVALPENPRTLVRTENRYGDSLDGAQLSPDGKRVALYGHDSGNPNLPNRVTKGTVQIWDLATRKLVFDLVGHRDWVKSTQWSHDGKLLASQSQDGMVVLWDAQLGKQLHVLAPALEMPEYSRPGKEKAISLEKIWLQLANGAKRPMLLGFSPDDRQVLALANKVEVPIPLPQRNGKPDFSLSQKYKTPLLLAWNVDDGKIARSVAFGKKGVTNNLSALSADGKTFVVSSSVIENGQDTQSQIEIRDVASGALKNATPLGGIFNYASELSNDGSRAVLIQWTGKDFVRERAQMWDVFAQKPLQVLADDETDFLRTEFSRDNAKLLASGRAGEIEIFDLTSGALERRLGGGHCGTVSTLQLTPDGTALISVGAMDSIVQVWDLTLSQSAAPLPHAIAHTQHARSVHFAPDGSFWSGWGKADGDEPRVPISLMLQQFAPGGKTLQTTSIPSEFIIDNVIFSPDFQLAAGALATQPRAAFVESEGVGVWDIAQQKLLWKFPYLGIETDTLTFSPDGQILATGQSHGRKIQLWNMRNGELLRTLPEPASGTGALCFSADGRTLAIGSMGGTIAFYEVQSAKFTGEITEDSAVTNLAFSPDGKYLLSGGDITVEYKIFGFKVHLWDVASGRLFREWTDDKRGSGGASFSPDGKTLALCHLELHDDRFDTSRIELWNIAEEKLTAVLRDICGARQPRFSPDGNSLVTVDLSWIKSWDLIGVPAQNAS